MGGEFGDKGVQGGGREGEEGWDREGRAAIMTIVD